MTVKYSRPSFWANDWCPEDSIVCRKCGKPTASKWGNIVGMENEEIVYWEGHFCPACLEEEYEKVKN